MADPPTTTQDSANHASLTTAAADCDALASATATTAEPFAAPLLHGSAGHLRSAFTPRILLLSFLAILAMAAATPYNDYVLQNTPLVGNHFPIGIVTVLLAIVLLVNPALTFLQRRPFAPGELIVLLALLLVSAAIPSSGLMRYLEPSILTPLDLRRFTRSVAPLLPSWLTPTHDPASTIVTSYIKGLDPLSGGRIPILAFLTPALLWLVLIAAVLGTTLFLAALFRKQWVHHERLSYPLATIPLELLAAPEPGRYFNKLWRNPVLWAGAAIPLLVHAAGGLHILFPQVPYVSLSFDFTGAFTEEPWNRLPHYLAANTLYLSVVGLTFFIPSEVALSLWLFLLARGLLQVVLSKSGIDPGPTEPLRGMGIYLAYFLGLLWIARRHLAYVLTAAWRGTPREAAELCSWRTMVLGLAACLAVAWGWLIAAGIEPAPAAMLLGLGFMLVTLMARVLAETGLFFLATGWQIHQFFYFLLGPKVMSTASYYYSAVVGGIFFGDLRETLLPYAATGHRLAADLKAPSDRPRLFACFFLALLAAILVSMVAHHALSYTFGRQHMADAHASYNLPTDTLTTADRFGRDIPPSISRGQAWGHVGFGGAMVVVVMAGRSLFTAWPFHPIGLLMMNAWTLQVFWSSILVGWAMKTLLLRYGGAMLYRRAKPFFIGLIVGEVIAAGAWMYLGLLTDGWLRYRFLPA